MAPSKTPKTTVTRACKQCGVHFLVAGGSYTKHEKKCTAAAAEAAAPQRLSAAQQAFKLAGTISPEVLQDLLQGEVSMATSSVTSSVAGSPKAVSKATATPTKAWAEAVTKVKAAKAALALVEKAPDSARAVSLLMAAQEASKVAIAVATEECRAAVSSMPKDVLYIGTKGSTGESFITQVKTACRFDKELTIPRPIQSALWVLYKDTHPSAKTVKQ